MAISIGRAVAVSYRHTDILFISEPLSFNQIGNNNITSIDTAATNNFTDIKLKKKLKKYSISNTLFNFNCNENDHNVNLNKNIKYKENNKYNFQNQYKNQNKNHNQSLKIINNCCCCINCTNIKLLEKFKNLNISSNILLQKQKHCKHLKISSSKKHCKFIKRKLVKCNKHKKVVCCKINHCIEIKTEIKTQIVKNSIKKISDKTIINPLKKEIEFAFEALTMNDIHKNGTNGPIMTTSGDKREHLYKILIIGELGTGKTSFIKRYVHKFFSQNYRATIGVDFALKVLHWDQNTIIRLQLWDIAGQERFGNMTRVYYKDAVGAFIVFDVTRSGTFECVSKWKEDLDSKVQLPDGSPIPCILLANKCDQEKQGLVTNPDKMDEYVKENGFAGWFETSAKENINIDESARALVNKILLNDKLISAADLDAEKIDLGGSSGYGGSGGKKKECAC